MDEGDDFDYNGLGGVVFDEEVTGSAEQGPKELQTGEVPAACAYGSDYESDDLATRSPVKKPKTETGRSGGGRKKGSTSTRQVHTPLTSHILTLRPVCPSLLPPTHTIEVNVPLSAVRACAMHDGL